MTLTINKSIAASASLRQLRPAKINFYLKFMAERGFENSRVLEGTGISARDLADQHYLVEISKYIRIISNINHLYKSSSLAFALGEYLTLGDLGILGYCVMSCDNTAKATRIWHAYNPIFFGNLIEVRFEKTGNQLLLTHLPYGGIRQDLLQFLVEEKICYDMALQRLIGIEKFPIEQLTLTYPKPGHWQCYAALIQCPIEFSAERSTMLLWDNAMSIPLHGRDPETHSYCIKFLNTLVTNINTGSTLSQKINTILSENLDRNLSITDIAKQLCCTSRTLNRALRKERVNFSDLTVAARLETAKNLLATTHMESKEIAARIGFSEVRSLRRFFKLHTGVTIKKFKMETVSGTVSGKSDQ